MWAQSEPGFVYGEKQHKVRGEKTEKQTAKETGKQTEKQAKKQAEKKAKKQAEKQAKKQTEKKAKKQTEKKAKKQAEKKRQINRGIARETNRVTSRRKKSIIMKSANEKLNFASDYSKGAHPAILKRLAETNMMQTAGYGQDEITQSARNRIREACGCPEAEVEFLAGGTQTNAVMIDAFLNSYEGVIAAETGHINIHEAGAIELNGHKVLALPQQFGKISAERVERYLEDFYHDANHEHMIMPGMIYLSQPTEYGTLYSRAELQAFRAVCDKYRIALYVDGARLAYALASEENDVTLKDLAELCDAFYIGGTKCGALLGEAVVIPDPDRIGHFFTIIKQHGALLAKGRVLGIQFDELFRDDLYLKIGKPAISSANSIRRALLEKGYRLFFDTPTNQIFCIMENEALSRLGEKVDYGFWEKYDDAHTVIRLAADWGTTEEDTRALINAL